MHLGQINEYDLTYPTELNFICICFLTLVSLYGTLLLFLRTLSFFLLPLFVFLLFLIIQISNFLKGGYQEETKRVLKKIIKLKRKAF